MALFLGATAVRGCLKRGPTLEMGGTRGADPFSNSLREAESLWNSEISSYFEQ
jgi:hypothetical protein